MVKLYAPYCYLVGAKEVQILPPKEAVTVRELLELLVAKWSRLAAHFEDLDQVESISSKMTVLVDGEIRDLDSLIGKDQRVEILGPLSGG
jgi:molybdopterin converting factor small subunit